MVFYEGAHRAQSSNDSITWCSRQYEDNVRSPSPDTDGGIMYFDDRREEEEEVFHSI